MEDVKRRYMIHHTVMAADFNYVLRDGDTKSNTRKPRSEAVCATIMTQNDLCYVAALCTIPKRIVVRGTW